MTGAEPGPALEDYLAALRAQLRARPVDPATSDLLDEMRDHLLCSVEQQVAGGLAARPAALRALAEFGRVDTVAGALRGELVRPHLRRLSTTLLVLGVVGGASWVGVLLAGPAEPWTEHTEPRPIVLFDAVGEFAGTATLLTAVLGALLIGCTGRFWRHPRLRACAQRWSLRACWASLTLGLLTTAQLGGYLLVRALTAPGSLIWPAVITTTAVTLAVVPLLARSVHTVAAMHPGQLLGSDAP